MSWWKSEVRLLGMRPFQFPLLLKTASKCSSFHLWDPVANTSPKTFDQNLRGDNATGGGSHLLQDYWVVSFKRQISLSWGRRDYSRACCFMHEELRSFLQIFPWRRGGCMEQESDSSLSPASMFEGSLNLPSQLTVAWSLWDNLTKMRMAWIGPWSPWND